MPSPSDPLARAKAFADPIRTLVQKIRASEAGTYGHEPRRDSEAVADLANDEQRADGSPWGSEPVVEAQSMPGLRLFAADDHLFALSELVGSHHSMLGWAVSCRNVLEAASRAWWLLEPGIGARGRMVRYLADAFQSEQYRGELLAGIGGASKPGGVGPIMATAARLGIDAVEVPNAGTLFDGVRVPPPAKLVHGLLDNAGFDAGEGFYRYLSGTTHGDRQAILDILEANDTSANENQAGPQIGHVRLIVQITLTGYAAAVMRSWAYQGWEPGEIRSLIKTAIDATNDD